MKDKDMKDYKRFDGKYYMQINWDFHIFDPTRISKQDTMFIIDGREKPIDTKSIIHFYVSQWNIDLYQSEKVIQFMKNSIPAKFTFHSFSVNFNTAMINHLISLYTEEYKQECHQMSIVEKPFRRVYHHQSVMDYSRRSKYIAYKQVKPNMDVYRIAIFCMGRKQAFSIHIMETFDIINDEIMNNLPDHSIRTVFSAHARIAKNTRNLEFQYDTNNGLQSASPIITGYGKKIAQVFIDEHPLIIIDSLGVMQDDEQPTQQLPHLDEIGELPYEKDFEQTMKYRWTRTKSNDKHYF